MKKRFKTRNGKVLPAARFLFPGPVAVLGFLVFSSTIKPEATAIMKSPGNKHGSFSE